MIYARIKRAKIESVERVGEIFNWPKSGPEDLGMDHQCQSEGGSGTWALTSRGF
jgi:hypothetical protein